LSGVGTDSPASVSNVLGDPTFFDRGGFTSIKISFRIGALDSEKIGAPIEELTRDLDPGDISASVWWPRLGLYLCAVGTDIFVWKNDPNSKMRGWSIWTVPEAITDFATDGVTLYARTEFHALIAFDDELISDFGVAIDFELETQFLHQKAPGVEKEYDAMVVYQTGSSEVSVRPSALDPTELIPIMTANGTTSTFEKIPLYFSGDSIAIRFTGVGPWKLSGFAIDYVNLGNT